MSYPTDLTSYTTKINKNASGWYVGPEYFNVPSTTPYELYLDHVPTDTKARSVGASGGAAWTEVLVAPTSVSQYLVDYVYGKVTFYSGNAGAAAQATYYSLGDDIMAEHMNDVQTGVVNIESELGASPAGSYSTVADRLNASDVSIAASGINGDRLTDNTVRSGALMNDIKGASWSATRDVLTDITAHKNVVSSAHSATAITAVGPGTTAPATVQGHISQVGSVAATATNPHGLALMDLGNSGIDTQSSITGRNIYAEFIGISGNIMSLGMNGPDGNRAIYFYDSALLTGQRLGWNNDDSKFELTANTAIYGTISASGTITPPSSGAFGVGTPEFPFLQGCFSEIYADTGYISDLYVSGDTLYIGGKAMSLSSDTMQIDSSMGTSASGMYSVGSESKPYSSGNFNIVQSVDYMTGNSQGTDGSFTTNDGKTITVKSGLIVSIV